MTVKEFGAVGDGTADDTDSIQSAINHIEQVGGGGLYFPTGKYRVSKPILLCRNLTLYGDGQRSSVLVSSHKGTCLRKVEAINGATPVHVVIRSLGLINMAGGANAGAGFHDTGGTYISVIDVLIENFKYGIILDQSELVDIDLCTIQHQSHSCIWLVNGPDFDHRAAIHFTNRISINRCQINGAGQFGILDDGGVAHVLRDNNYNGCGIAHIRAASVTNLTISGGEYEGAGSRSLILTFHTLAGIQVGGCGVVLIENAFMAPSKTNSSIEIHNCSVLSLVSCAFGNTHDESVPAIIGMANISNLFEAGCGVDGLGPMFDRPGNPTSSVFSVSKMAMRKAGPPTKGHWDKGDIVWNNHVDPANDAIDYWKCVASGSPGRWMRRP